MASSSSSYSSPWAQLPAGATWHRRDGHAINIPLRVVAHVDMDCFYVQVEQRKQPQLRGRPTAVKQYNPWRGGGLIAVSYEARRHGVTRHMRGDEAKKRCPDLQLIQVPTAHGKADLTDYRNAGAEVVAILSRAGPCERASIDEAYIDLTDAVRARLGHSPCKPEDLSLEARKTHIAGQPEGGEDDAAALWLCNAEDMGDHMLACGAIIIAELRQAILTETQFTCSAGIAHNKMLAKLASGLNKPAQQTLIPLSGVLPLLKSLPLQAVKQLGGKLGRSVAADFGAQTAGDLWCISEQRLQDMYGANTGSWLWKAVRGLYDEPVQERVLPKSLSCGKTFRGRNMLKDLTKVGFWLKELSEELDERLEEDRNLHDRTAQLLTVSVSITNASNRPHTQSISRSCPLRYGGDKIVADAGGLVKRIVSGQVQWAIESMFLSASNIISTPQNSVSIRKFLRLSSVTVPTSHRGETAEGSGAGSELLRGEGAQIDSNDRGGEAEVSMESVNRKKRKTEENAMQECPDNGAGNDGNCSRDYAATTSECIERCALSAGVGSAPDAMRCQRILWCTGDVNHCSGRDCNCDGDLDNEGDRDGWREVSAVEPDGGKGRSSHRDVGSAALELYRQENSGAARHIQQPPYTHVCLPEMPQLVEHSHNFHVSDGLLNREQVTSVMINDNEVGRGIEENSQGLDGGLKRPEDAEGDCHVQEMVPNRKEPGEEHHGGKAIRVCEEEDRGEVVQGLKRGEFYLKGGRKTLTSDRQSLDRYITRSLAHGAIPELERMDIIEHEGVREAREDNWKRGEELYVNSGSVPGLRQVSLQQMTKADQLGHSGIAEAHCTSARGELKENFSVVSNNPYGQVSAQDDGIWGLGGGQEKNVMTERVKSTECIQDDNNAAVDQALDCLPQRIGATNAGFDCQQLSFPTNGQHEDDADNVNHSFRTAAATDSGNSLPTVVRSARADCRHGSDTVVEGSKHCEDESEEGAVVQSMKEVGTSDGMFPLVHLWSRATNSNLPFPKTMKECHSNQGSSSGCMSRSSKKSTLIGLWGKVLSAQIALKNARTEDERADIIDEDHAAATCEEGNRITKLSTEGNNNVRVQRVSTSPRELERRTVVAEYGPVVRHETDHSPVTADRFTGTATAGGTAPAAGDSILVADDPRPNAHDPGQTADCPGARGGPDAGFPSPVSDNLCPVMADRAPCSIVPALTPVDPSITRVAGDRGSVISDSVPLENTGTAPVFNERVQFAGLPTVSRSAEQPSGSYQRPVHLFDTGVRKVVKTPQAEAVELPSSSVIGEVLTQAMPANDVMSKSQRMALSYEREKIDMAVLTELPVDMQREVCQSLGLSMPRSERHADSAPGLTGKSLQGKGGRSKFRRTSLATQRQRMATAAGPHPSLSLQMLFNKQCQKHAP